MKKRVVKPLIIIKVFFILHFFYCFYHGFSGADSLTLKLAGLYAVVQNTTLAWPFVWITQ